MTALAIYYTAADVLLIFQCFLYMRKPESAPLLENSSRSETSVSSESSDFSDTLGLLPHVTPAPLWRTMLFNGALILAVFGAGILGWCFSSTRTTGGDDNNNPHDQLEFNLMGQFFGYLCTAFYLSSRVPQILLNYRRKSCEGVSFLFFMFACLGNVMFVISILVQSLSWQYLLINASWLMSSIGALSQDFLIMTQFWLYEKKNDEDLFYEEHDNVQAYQSL